MSTVASGADHWLTNLRAELTPAKYQSKEKE
jgi:hypothetical protein